MLWILFDLEATGFNIIHDRITQIGALAICNKKTISTFSEYVNPLKPLHPKAAQVTNLSDTFLQQFPNFRIVWQKFGEWIVPLIEERKEKIVWVTHNGFRFDFMLLKNEMARYSLLEPFQKLLEQVPMYAVDTLLISKQQYSFLTKHTLLHVWRYAMNKTNEDQFVNAHNALGDCQALSDIILSENFNIHSPFSTLLISFFLTKQEQQQQPKKPKEDKKDIELVSCMIWYRYQNQIYTCQTPFAPNTPLPISILVNHHNKRKIEITVPPSSKKLKTTK